MRLLSPHIRTTAIVSLLFIITGCASASLHVVKALPAPPVTEQISLNLTTNTDSRMPKDVLDSFRSMITTKLSEKGFQFGSSDTVKVVGTVNTYDPGNRFGRWLFPGLGAGYFNSTWVVLNKKGEEIAKANIDGSIYAGGFGGAYEDVLEHAAERVVDFLSKKILEEEV